MIHKHCLFPLVPAEGRFASLAGTTLPAPIKPDAALGRLIKRIRRANTLDQLMEAVVGRSRTHAPHISIGNIADVAKNAQLTSEESVEFYSAYTRLSIVKAGCNRNVTLTFGLANSAAQTDDQAASKTEVESLPLRHATTAVLEWLHRCGRKLYGRQYERMNESELPFVVAIPEVWSKTGRPVPLHYHMTVTVPPDRCDWFDKNASDLWQKTVSRVTVTYSGGAYVQTIDGNIGAVAGYNTKHCNTAWSQCSKITTADWHAYKSL